MGDNMKINLEGAFKSLTLKNVLGNIAAILALLQIIYPGLQWQDIYASYMDGTLFTHAVNGFIAYVTYNYGKRTATRYNNGKPL